MLYRKICSRESFETSDRTRGRGRYSHIRTRHDLQSVTKEGCGIPLERQKCLPAGGVGVAMGGGGGIASLSVGTNCETTAPPFWTKDSPCFATSKFTAPSFHRCPRTALGNLE